MPDDHQKISDDDLELRRMLDAPKEHLNVEIKNWLRMDDHAHKADLAKAILALANHGGGRILIGWTEAGNKFYPDSPRPDDLSCYSQDAINGVVAAYAEPVFHCEV